MKKTKLITIDEELLSKATEKAKSLGLNLSAYIRLLLSQELQKGEKKSWNLGKSY